LARLRMYETHSNPTELPENFERMGEPNSDLCTGENYV
jgi:hypothetical protein